MSPESHLLISYAIVLTALINAKISYLQIRRELVFNSHFNYKSNELNESFEHLCSDRNVSISDKQLQSYPTPPTLATH